MKFFLREDEKEIKSFLTLDVFADYLINDDITDIGENKKLIDEFLEEKNVISWSPVTEIGECEITHFTGSVRRFYYVDDNSIKQSYKNYIVRLTGIEKHNNWVFGECHGYTFFAKVYAYKSKYGIDGGRISKLTISNGIQYDRGWVIEPNKFTKPVYDAIINFFEDWGRDV